MNEIKQTRQTHSHGTIEPAASKISYSMLVHFTLAMIILTAGMYCSTGTLAPYANTLDPGTLPGYPIADPECQYLYNGDYDHFRALFSMLDGAPKSEWGFSVYHRRILYNLLAYPMMKFLGHDDGGIVVNFLLTWLAVISFVWFLFRDVGERGAIIGIWLLATYPGIAYFIGQPFLHALIVPECLWLYIIVRKLDTKIIRTSHIIFLSLLMGVLFAGYDLIVFFGVAALGVLFVRKRFWQIPVSVVCMLLPSILWGFILTYHYGGHYSSDNSSVYSVILKSYFLPKDYRKWVDLLRKLPSDTIENFFFSVFFFLAVLFVLVLLSNLRGKYTTFHLAEIAIIGSIALVFFFNNFAPPYPGWQMREDEVIRFYQPLFVALLVFIVRVYQTALTCNKGRVTNIFLYSMLVLTIVGNSLVVFGPIMNDPLNVASHVYWRFYKHSPPYSLKMNVAKYGRRPLGFCQKP